MLVYSLSALPGAAAARIARAFFAAGSGFVGDDVDTVLHKLLLSAGMDVQRAQTGIVFLDEVDKLRSQQSFGAKDLRLAAPHALLILIEGSLVPLPPGGGPHQVRWAGSPCPTRLIGG